MAHAWRSWSAKSGLPLLRAAASVTAASSSGSVSRRSACVCAGVERARLEALAAVARRGRARARAAAQRVGLDRLAARGGDDQEAAARGASRCSASRPSKVVGDGVVEIVEPEEDRAVLADALEGAADDEPAQLGPVEREALAGRADAVGPRRRGPEPLGGGGDPGRRPRRRPGPRPRGSSAPSRRRRDRRARAGSAAVTAPTTPSSGAAIFR